MLTIYTSLTVEEVGNVPLQFVGSHYLSSSQKHDHIRFPLICKTVEDQKKKKKKNDSVFFGYEVTKFGVCLSSQ